MNFRFTHAPLRMPPPVGRSVSYPRRGGSERGYFLVGREYLAPLSRPRAFSSPQPAAILIERSGEIAALRVAMYGQDS